MPGSLVAAAARWFPFPWTEESEEGITITQNGFLAACNILAYLHFIDDAESRRLIGDEAGTWRLLASGARNFLQAHGQHAEPRDCFLLGAECGLLRMMIALLQIHAEYNLGRRTRSGDVVQ